MGSQKIHTKFSKQRTHQSGHQQVTDHGRNTHPEDQRADHDADQCQEQIGFNNTFDCAAKIIGHRRGLDNADDDPHTGTCRDKRNTSFGGFGQCLRNFWPPTSLDQSEDQQTIHAEEGRTQDTFEQRSKFDLARFRRSPGVTEKTSQLHGRGVAQVKGQLMNHNTAGKGRESGQPSV